jgi:hypothetical protein
MISCAGCKFLSRVRVHIYLRVLEGLLVDHDSLLCTKYNRETSFFSISIPPPPKVRSDVMWQSDLNVINMFSNQSM